MGDKLRWINGALNPIACHLFFCIDHMSEYAPLSLSMYVSFFVSLQNFHVLFCRYRAARYVQSKSVFDWTKPDYCDALIAIKFLIETRKQQQKNCMQLSMIYKCIRLSWQTHQNAHVSNWICLKLWRGKKATECTNHSNHVTAMKLVWYSAIFLFTILV